MLPAVVSRLFILLFGTLYPAYNSYKAVRNKDPREYVKCMMYWIVFALYSTVETFTDVFLSFWFPFYHELKILILLWLMSPTTRGSTYLYTKIVHPALTNREQEIDEAIALAKQQGYHAVMKLGSKGVHYASNVIMQTALKGGGELMNQLQKSYSCENLLTRISIPPPCIDMDTASPITKPKRNYVEMDFKGAQREASDSHLPNAKAEFDGPIDLQSSQLKKCKSFAPTRSLITKGTTPSICRNNISDKRFVPRETGRCSIRMGVPSTKRRCGIKTYPPALGIPPSLRLEGRNTRVFPVIGVSHVQPATISNGLPDSWGCKHYFTEQSSPAVQKVVLSAAHLTENPVKSLQQPLRCSSYRIRNKRGVAPFGGFFPLRNKMNPLVIG